MTTRNKKTFWEKKWNSVRKRLRFLAFPIIKKKTDLVIIEQKGGVASQLGLYVVGEYLRTLHGYNVAYDFSWFENEGMAIDGKNTRCWELENLFEVSLPRADSEITQMLRDWCPFCVSDSFDSTAAFEELLRATPPYFMRSEQSSPRLFLTMLPMLQALKFRKAVIDDCAEELKHIQKFENSCALHVRRGDYVGSIHDVCGADYFLGAIKEVSKRIGNTKTSPLKLFIFSNGFDWVRENLIPRIPADIEYEIMEKNDNDHMHGDFYLMSMCRHQIVSNSGFSWLSSLLQKEEPLGAKNTHRIIIEPTEWVLGYKRKPFCGHIGLTRDGTPDE